MMIRNQPILKMIQLQEKTRRKLQIKHPMKRSTVEYLIQHDKKELLDVVNEFRKDVDDDFLDTVLELEELVDVYLPEEFLEKEPIRIKIDEVSRKLEGSAAIPKSNQLRLKMMLDDIAQNRLRVHSILRRLADEEGEEQLSFTLEQLAREALLSEEQHLELAEALQNDDLYSLRVAVIKNSKVRQGLKFLPPKLNDQVKSLQVLLEELTETGENEVRNKVAAVIKGLLRRNGISLDQQTTIKEDNNIV